MQLWNIRRLAQRLANGEVGDKEKLYYLLFVIASWSSVFCSRKHGNFEIAIDAVDTLFALFLAWRAYVINRQGDGQHFIERYICLNVPLTLRSIAIGVCGAMLLDTFVPLPFELSMTVLMVAMYIYIYRLLMKSIRIAAGITKDA